MSHVLTLCGTCKLGQGDFAETLTLPGFTIARTDCMSGCTRPSTIAFRAPGKVAYLFGEITEADRAEIETFAAAYKASSDGTFPDARIFGGLRMKAIARIPG